MLRTNEAVARALGELARLTEIDEGSPQAFRVRAYQNAQRAVEQLSTDVSQMSASQLAQVKGIGKSIAGRIREFAETGRIDKLEELRAKHPRGKLELMRIPGLGAKSVQLLESTLGITDMEGLRAALDDGRLAALPGMGERTADKLRQSIESMGLSSKVRRMHLYEAMPVAERLVAELREVEGVVDAAYAGSLRRFKETIGDLDLLVATDDAGPVTERFLSVADVDQVLGSGGTKSSIVTPDGLQVDLRVVPPESFGAALLYFTGSKAHNIRLRQLALKRGWTLNEYALAELPEDVDPEEVAGEAEPSDGSGTAASDAEAASDGSDPTSGGGGAIRRETGPVVASRSERDIYAALELPWIPAELREDDGEIESAIDGDLPQLVERADLQGDLHDHTDLSGDGRATLEEMVDGAVARGLSYVAITDHAENLSINGVSRTAMLAQRRELRELEQRRGDIHLFHGAELNIGIDGSLDYDAGFLATFDWLVASVHSHFGRSVEEQTARIVAAIREPSVTAIGHLTGRMLGKRPGIEIDPEQVLDAAAETGTAIEINCSPRRLDAPVEILREGQRRGVTFVISTDAHAVAELDRARFGIAHARRAALEPSVIANTWDVDRFRRWIADVRG